MKSTRNSTLNSPLFTLCLKLSTLRKGFTMDKKKILVVEDEKAIADILVFNLQREGYDTL